jgi:hypothetical protein
MLNGRELSVDPKDSSEYTSSDSGDFAPCFLRVCGGLRGHFAGIGRMSSTLSA